MIQGYTSPTWTAPPWAPGPGGGAGGAWGEGQGLRGGAGDGGGGAVGMVVRVYVWASHTFGSLVAGF